MSRVTIYIGNTIFLSGDEMEIIAQGITGLVDTFLHADYLSSVSRTDFTVNESTPYGVLISITLLIVGLGIFIYLQIRKNRRAKEKKERKKGDIPE